MRYRLNSSENFAEKNPERRQVGIRSSKNENFFCNYLLLVLLLSLLLLLLLLLMIMMKSLLQNLN